MTKCTDVLERRARVLHVAPEANLRRFLASQRHLAAYVTADLVRGDVDLRFDLQAIPFADAYFEIAICNHVLQECQRIERR